MKYILTQSALDALCKKFHIPDTVHPKLPGPNDRIRNSPIGKISVYSRFFDFLNDRIPLSQFLIDVIGYFRINLSQLSVIAAAKIPHFEILCRIYDFIPTVRNFRRFYINSKNKGWISFSKRSDTGPVCYTKPLYSFKNWNDHLFWVDAFVFPLSVPWHHNKTLRKDPPPTPAKFNVKMCDYLVDNPSPFRKLLEPLCFVGISRYYELDENCYPTFWTDDDEGADRGKKVREREVLLLQLTRDRVVLLANVNDQGNQHEPKRIRKKRKAADGAGGSGLPPQKIKEYQGTYGTGASVGGKSIAAL
ncbi:hypothetical protein Tco_1170249 [Tanacetum coccineum]